MRHRILSGLIAFLAIAIITGSDVRVSQARRQEAEVYKNIELFIEALRRVQSDYVEPVDDKALIYGAMQGMLMSLDPYSAFLEPALRQELEMETRGEFEGVGMEITRKDGVITVVSPIEETPAWNAGIQAGDMIVEIEGESTKNYTTMEAARKLRGEKGTEVTISIMRKGVPEIMEITLRRDRIVVQSVIDRMVNGLGYIRIRDFQERTASDMRQTLIKMDNNDIKGLVLDLRNNPGGLLTSAIYVSDLFLEPGKMIVYTKGRDDSTMSEFKSRTAQSWNKPIVFLVNQGSASASEILIGAVKDHIEETVIAGEETFGKGSVQNLINLADGSALKLTVAHYYTPSGTAIEGKGIAPDIYIESPEERIIPGSDDDMQLEKALEILRELLEQNG